MASKSACLALLCLAATSDAAVLGRGSAGAEQARSLLQTYNQQLSGSVSGSKAQVTPVTRVVNLLKEMQTTLNKEQDEDSALYDKLACWCNNNKYEKTGSSDAATAKIADLQASIEGLTAKSAELNTEIKELNSGVASDKQGLAQATAQREKQLKEFHALELDNVEAIENLKAAIVVLGRHNGAAFPQTQVPVSFIATVTNGKQGPWAADHESHLSHSFDEFLSQNSFATGAASPTQGFLQDAHASNTAAAKSSGWSAEEMRSVKKALKSASAFVQSRHGYYPSYAAKSGEIFGVLKQLKEEMEGALGEEQKQEAMRAASFAELRSAKTSEIESGEKRAEQKEDELATADMDNAEAKEDLEQTTASLSEDQKFLMNLEATCKDADANFDLRKSSRLEEIHAVSQTIEILMKDDARDAMDTTFSLIQTAHTSDKHRKDAATILRSAASKTHSPELSMLASSVELDAFTKVKAMIDKMIAQLKTQSEDEVKKNNWCNTEIQQNEMTTLKTNDLKADLQATIGQLENTIKTLSEEVEKARLDIAGLQTALQRASENRKQENLDFQKVVADQMVTAEVLATALDKLATFYDNAAFAQTQKGKQTPPVPQVEYSKSKGSTGVMSMIEKLIYDTKSITAESKKSESEAQAGYEALVADTNASILDLSRSITSKTKDKARAKKDLQSTNSDLGDAETELENLGKYNADLHGECDYIMKNFGIRQEGRAQEIAALQQAKQILNGANLS